MSAEFQRVKEIFLAAVEKISPEERAAYLRAACGEDAALLRQVEALLRRHEQAGSFLEPPALDPQATGDVPPSAADAPHAPLETGVAAEGAAAAVGSRIGPYKLLQELGEGGMG